MAICGVAKELYGRQIENKLNVKGSYRSFDQLMDDWDNVRISSVDFSILIGFPLQIPIDLFLF